ncbi:hypothetical protein AWC38_SpisGene10187 [Stylophora pistillata]|uniref:Endonuclease/exonuclease/phosphatase domain-containing protein n=1 Tax=Stylophora pistillata TaxID=50429 RepID=A0A2B4S381_STYPI|nr:hypothetical protein AWC38_SpisGene10187 [Stylophora pistillata]
MSETWLKDNPLLRHHVTIPGYNCELRSRNSIRGGGVGAYIKETLTYKSRSDIAAKELDLEQLWLEFPGRNKHKRISHTDHVLPCPLVSDHDAVYATINIKVTRFKIRHKFIRNLKNFDESSFIEDFKPLPFAASFGVSDPDEKLEILSSLIKECIDKHAPLKLTKVTRPPAPWLKDPVIAELKEQRDRLRSAAGTSNNNKETWEKFRAARNRLKELIKSTKRNFMERILSSKKPKEVWRVIHRILHPSPQRITMQPDKQNNFFASTAERTIGINAHHVDDHASIINLIQSLPANFDNGFQIRTVTLKEVIHELRNI